VQGDTIAHLEQALGAALGLAVNMGLTRMAPRLVHLSRSDSVGSISLAGNSGEALLNYFIQNPSQRFEDNGLVGVRLVTAHLHVIAPRTALKPELVGHLVHALREQQRGNSFLRSVVWSYGVYRDLDLDGPDPRPGAGRADEPGAPDAGEQPARGAPEGGRRRDGWHH